MASKAIVPVLVACMLLTGTANTLLTKYQDMQCVAHCDTKHPKRFEQPVLQSLQMFVGEAGCWLIVLLSWLMTRARGKSQEYKPIADEEVDEIEEDQEHTMSTSQTLIDPTNLPAAPLIDGESQQRPLLTGSRILLLALPAICDICGTTLMNVGLLLVAASIYQMTRGVLVLFVGLMSVIFLKRHLGVSKWVSLLVVVAGVAIVGAAGALDKDHKEDLSLQALQDIVDTQEVHTALESIVGVLLIAGGQIFSAAQFVFEESLLSRYSIPATQVVGWEGVFGFSITLLLMGILHATIGRNTGGYFDAEEAFRQVFTNRTIAVTSILIMISIGGFNFFGLSVTRRISATARSTIDTCRTLFIWLFSLGLGWETFKWLQVPGFAALVYGTMLFNEIISPPTISWLERRLGRQRSVALED